MMTPDAAKELTQKVLTAMMASGSYDMRRDAEIDLAALQSYSYRTGYSEGQEVHQKSARPLNPNNTGY